MKAITLYRFALSGHSHRVELMLSLLQLPVQLVEIDLVQGEHKRPAFLERNPFGQVPLIDDDGVLVADSNAILVYLVKRYAGTQPWLPTEAVAAAEVQRWLSLAAGPLAAGPSLARAAVLFKRSIDLEPARNVGRQLFERMDAHLASRRFLAAAHVTIADIAMYSYTAHAPEGGISLLPYTNVRRWLADIEALPHFVPLRATMTEALAALNAAL
jgi:glutathione S-transferase